MVFHFCCPLWIQEGCFSRKPNLLAPETETSEADSHKITSTWMIKSMLSWWLKTKDILIAYIHSIYQINDSDWLTSPLWSSSTHRDFCGYQSFGFVRRTKKGCLVDASSLAFHRVMWFEATVTMSILSFVGVSLNGGKPPKMDGENRNILLKWMIWGYPYFWKHPYRSSEHFCWVLQFRCFSKDLCWKLAFSPQPGCCIDWVWPSPSNSDHQDCYTFSRGFL